MSDSNLRVLTAFRVGPVSVAVTIPKSYGIEVGTRLVVTRDEKGSIRYRPLPPENLEDPEEVQAEKPES